MPDFLQRADDWLAGVISNHVTQLASFVWQDTNAGPVSTIPDVPVTLVDVEGRVLDGQSSKTQSEFTVFMVERQIVDTNNIPITNALSILWEQSVYMPSPYKGKLFRYNTGYRKHIVIHTKFNRNLDS